ncbi:bifunctional purine biosynthesis protein PurH [Alicyclobacillus cellulosilyticus]|uniref:Bifunctional purine biosynthesis protein PurH n=1 Tax=Alicyclobacillus cellulosilyticus TaxID=1003997 RepID=A0A917KFD0_9BACL|nr:bifunctional phosphoribosylaminoimidazolecarboxamide formyltransferase/IMP cyclohydrolase [Alicyclobacillus cellulosilyticus]GGJ09855.1 bifunctional purine biosynthesis protein PurH [Alicyclobacillus cellulosilyticus]
MAAWALVSVYDKRGVVAFCRRLREAGYGILSTGGTARHLQEHGIPVTLVEEYTGFPELLDGRVKTLHPKVHGGLLGLRDDPRHVAQMAAHGMERIDVVAVNLYPFTDTVARPGVTFAEAIEMIDIGGPAMLRAAAKNHRFCAPVVDPDDYPWVADALCGGGLSDAQRVYLAAKVFAATSAYDAAIRAYLASFAAKVQPGAGQAGTGPDGQAGADRDGAGAAAAACGKPDAEAAWPEVLTVSFFSRQPLRYGENPHQPAHFYADPGAGPQTIAGARQWQGKELSYNNIQDADAALTLLRSLDDLGKPAVVAVKHMNPCGVGIGETIHEAFARAHEADPVSIFGGIVACNRPVDEALAERLTELFLEIVVAPSFTDAALARFARKKNVRLLTVDMQAPLWRPDDLWFRRVSGGILVQRPDVALARDWQVVTERAPSEAERRALDFAWRVVKHVKSNAIVLANETMTLGIGAGQMNRVGAAKIAIAQAGARAKGAVLASDAFFPMRDTVDAAAAAGVTAIIQPGGSIRDAESIAAANEHGIAMVFTGERHFWH